MCTFERQLYSCGLHQSRGYRKLDYSCSIERKKKDGAGCVRQDGINTRDYTTGDTCPTCNPGDQYFDYDAYYGQNASGSASGGNRSSAGRGSAGRPHGGSSRRATPGAPAPRQGAPAPRPGAPSGRTMAPATTPGRTSHQAPSSGRTSRQPAPRGHSRR